MKTCSTLSRVFLFLCASVCFQSATPSTSATTLPGGEKAGGTLSGTTAPPSLPQTNPPANTGLGNSAVQLQLHGQPNETYLIQASTDLENWNLITVTRADAEGGLTFTDTQAASFKSRFFRGLRSDVSTGGPRLVNEAVRRPLDPIADSHARSGSGGAATSHAYKDSDGEGLIDSKEFALGLNARVAAVPDTNNVIRLLVYTPLQ